MKFFYTMGSHIGKKKSSNQDRILIKIGEAEDIGEFGLFCVADGMGGMDEGEKASRYAVDTLKTWWDQLKPHSITHFRPKNITSELEARFSEINLQIKEYGRANNKRLGTTLSVLFLAKNGFAICHIGDSRIYRLNRACMSIHQLTEDHSLVADLVRKGSLTAEEALTHPKKNILTRCLGIHEQVQPFTISGLVDEEDIFLICSDGLYTKVSADFIVQTVLGRLWAHHERFLLIEKLIEAANKNGGNDNISAIITWNIGRNRISPGGGRTISGDMVKRLKSILSFNRS